MFTHKASGAWDALGKGAGLVETSEAVARYGALGEYGKAGTLAGCLTDSFDDLVEIVLYPCQVDIHLHCGDLHRFTPKLSLNAYASTSAILRWLPFPEVNEHLSTAIQVDPNDQAPPSRLTLLVVTQPPGRI